MRTGSAMDHTHAVELGDAATSKDAGHRHAVEPGAENTETAHDHVHALPDAWRVAKASEDISGCMEEPAKVDEYPDEKQRAAVCYSMARKLASFLGLAKYSPDQPRDDHGEWTAGGGGGSSGGEGGGRARDEHGFVAYADHKDELRARLRNEPPGLETTSLDLQGSIEGNSDWRTEMSRGEPHFVVHSDASDAGAVADKMARFLPQQEYAISDRRQAAFTAVHQPSGQAIEVHVTGGEGQHTVTFARAPRFDRAPEPYDHGSSASAYGDERTRKFDVGFSAVISKVDPEQRLVSGWFSVIADGAGEVTDLQGDRIREAELVKTAHDFVTRVRAGKAMHAGDQIGDVVESVVFTRDLQKALGIDLGQVGWFATMKVTDDATWARVKSGELTAFSIGGRGRRVPAE